MSKKLILALSILAMVFAGCNESDDESKDGGTNDNTGGGSSSGNLTKIAYVKGLYNITSGGDEAYLHISDAGLVATYDFQGDSVDNGSNCYEKNPSNLNAPINNKTLTQNDSETRFEIGSYYWIYDSTNQNIKQVSIGGITAGGLLDMNGVRMGSSTKLATSPTIAEITQSICP